MNEAERCVEEREGWDAVIHKRDLTIESLEYGAGSSSSIPSSSRCHEHPKLSANTTYCENGKQLNMEPNLKVWRQNIRNGLDLVHLGRIQASLPYEW